MRNSAGTNWSHQVIAERGITRLCHLTFLENLELMMKDDAIWDRATLESRSRQPSYFDSNRNDGHRDLICLTVEYPNVWMMEKPEMVGRDFIILCVKPTLIGRERALFSRENAAKNSGAELQPDREGFEAMYADQVGIFFRKIGCHPKSCPTNFQAEVLVPGPITMEDILGIVVSNSDDEVRVRQTLKEYSRTLRVIIEPDFFNTDVIKGIRGGKAHIKLAGISGGS